MTTLVVRVAVLLNTKELEVKDKERDFTMQDNIFYFGIYVFVMTDFYCRIFPLLAYTVLLHKYFKTLTKFPLLNVFVGAFPAAVIISLFELLVYYLMLKRKAKTFRNAIKYFWTGTFTISYYLLSTMHLTYLPSNVRFVRMYRAHLVRMVIQILFMCIAIGMQYELFNKPLGFFNRSVFFFGFNMILNLMILIWIRCYMTVFEKKLNYNLSEKR